MLAFAVRVIIGVGGRCVSAQAIASTESQSITVTPDTTPVTMAMLRRRPLPNHASRLSSVGSAAWNAFHDGRTGTLPIRLGSVCVVSAGWSSGITAKPR